MLKVDIQHFASYGSGSIKFVETTLANFKRKLNSAKNSNNYPNSNTIYFVSTNYTNSTKDTNAEALGSPYLLYRGDQIVGNSSILSVSGQNGISVFRNDILDNPSYKYVSSSINPIEYSTASETVQRFYCDVYHSDEYIQDLTNNDVIKNNANRFLDLSIFDNFKKLLKNIQFYVEYYNTDETQTITLSTIALMMDSDSIDKYATVDSLTANRDSDKSALLDVCLFESEHEKYPLGKLYINRDIDKTLEENKNYLFSIEFASYSNPIVVNNVSYYNESITSEAKLNISGIYKFNINRSANNDSNVKLITYDFKSKNKIAFYTDTTINENNNPSNEYIISEGNNKDLYNIFEYYNDYNPDTSVSYGLANFKAQDDKFLVLFELVSNEYSKLFANFNRFKNINGLDNEDINVYSEYENNYIVNVSNVSEISTAIPGMVGQTLFVVDTYKDMKGNEFNGTTMYYWSEADIDGNTVGTWKNANILYTSKLMIDEDLSLTASEIAKLKELLQD